MMDDGKFTINLPGFIAENARIGVIQPVHGSIIKDADGKYTYLPKRGYYGKDSFGYKVSHGKRTSKAVVHLTVKERKDPTATITLESGFRPDKTKKTKPNADYRLDNSQTNGLPNAFKLDWQGNATNRDRKNNEHWMVDYVASKEAKQLSLAELTGLKVKLD